MISPFFLRNFPDFRMISELFLHSIYIRYNLKMKEPYKIDKEISHKKFYPSV